MKIQNKIYVFMYEYISYLIHTFQGYTINMVETKLIIIQNYILLLIVLMLSIYFL